MDRKQFLKSLGLAGIGLALPLRKTFAETSRAASPSSPAACALVPSETAGPYPLDLSGKQQYFRQDIREDKNGARLDLKMRIMNVNGCVPVRNARVDIWHCDKDGYYSGYTNAGYLGSRNSAGLTFCRGIQMTDASGEVRFITVFPGWYQGRVTHIHFQVFLNSVSSVVSQFAFPETPRNAIQAGSLYAAHGADPLTTARDSIFSDGAGLQMATLAPNAETGGEPGGYTSEYEASINAGATGIMKLEPETGGEFKLGQNVPNPYLGETFVPFTLANRSDVKLDLFELSGERAAEIVRPGLEAGSRGIKVHVGALGIPNRSYVYQLQVGNGNGVFRQCKLMTSGV